MANQSSVPAVKAAMLSLLTTALPGTDVKWANTSADTSREAAWMGNADFSEEAVAAFRTGTLPHNEVYVLPVVLQAVGDGDDPQATELRAWTLTATVEQALRAAPTLGVAGVHWAKVQNKEALLLTRDGGWVMFVVLSVGIQARI